MLRHGPQPTLITLMPSRGGPTGPAEQQGARARDRARVTATDLALPILTLAHQGSHHQQRKEQQGDMLTASGAAWAAASLSSHPQETRSLCTAPEPTP